MNESDSLTIIIIIDPLILKLCFHSDLYQLAAKELWCRGGYCFCIVQREIEIVRKGKKEDVAFITLARSLVTFQNFVKEMKKGLLN
jgi:hypothetical protein